METSEPLLDKVAIKQQLFEYLFTNLDRSIYELYTLVEYDLNEQHCISAVDALKDATRDFEELRDRIRVIVAASEAATGLAASAFRSSQSPGVGALSSGTDGSVGPGFPISKSPSRSTNQTGTAMQKRGGIAWEVRTRSRLCKNQSALAHAMIRSMLQRMSVGVEQTYHADEEQSHIADHAVYDIGKADSKEREESVGRDDVVQSQVHPSAALDVVPVFPQDDKPLPTVMSFDAPHTASKHSGWTEGSPARTATTAVRQILATPPRASRSPGGQKLLHPERTPAPNSSPRGPKPALRPSPAEPEVSVEAQSMVMLLAKLEQGNVKWGDLLVSEPPLRPKSSPAPIAAHETSIPTIDTPRVPAATPNPWHNKLQAKLSSPERSRLTPEQTRAETQRRHAQAEANKVKLDEERRKRLGEQQMRSKDVYDRQAARLREEEALNQSRHEAAYARRQEHLDAKRAKADTVSQKVNEVHFINAVHTENKRQELLRKSDEADRRKGEHIANRRAKTELYSKRVVETVESRKLAEAAAKDAKLAAMQQKLVESEARRREALKTRVGPTYSARPRVSSLSYASILGGHSDTKTAEPAKAPSTSVKSAPAHETVPAVPAPPKASAFEASVRTPPESAEMPVPEAEPESPWVPIKTRARKPKLMMSPDDERIPSLHVAVSPVVRSTTLSITSLTNPATRPVSASGTPKDSVIERHTAAKQPTSPEAPAVVPTVAPIVVEHAKQSEQVAVAAAASTDVSSSAAAGAGDSHGADKNRKKKLKKHRQAVESASEALSKAVGGDGGGGATDTFSQLSKLLAALKRECTSDKRSGDVVSSKATKSVVSECWQHMRRADVGKRVHSESSVVLRDPLQFAAAFIDISSSYNSEFDGHSRLREGTGLDNALPTSMGRLVCFAGGESVPAQLRPMFGDDALPGFSVTSTSLQCNAKSLMRDVAGICSRDFVRCNPATTTRLFNICTAAACTDAGYLELLQSSLCVDTCDIICHFADKMAEVLEHCKSESFVCHVATPESDDKFIDVSNTLPLMMASVAVLWAAIRRSPQAYPEVAALVRECQQRVIIYMLSSGCLKVFARVVEAIRLTPGKQQLQLIPLLRLVLSTISGVLLWVSSLGSESSLSKEHYDAAFQTLSDTCTFDCPALSLSIVHAVVPSVARLASDLVPGDDTRNALLQPDACTILIECFHVMNLYAMADTSRFQTALTKTESTSTARHALDLCLLLAVPAAAMKSNSHKILFDALLSEILIFITYFAQNNQVNQESLHWGKQPTTLQRLCELPFHYFSHPAGRQLLFPALIVATYKSPLNAAVIAKELSPQLLKQFIVDAIANPLTDTATELARRFPREHWEGYVAFIDSLK